MKYIEAFNDTGAHDAPAKIADKWQITYLNSRPEDQLEQILKVDIHHQTDEAFVLA